MNVAGVPGKVFESLRYPRLTGSRPRETLSSQAPLGNRRFDPLTKGIVDLRSWDSWDGTPDSRRAGPGDLSCAFLVGCSEKS